MQTADSLDSAVPNFAPLRRSLIVSAVLPAVAIQVLAHYGVPVLQAILWSALFPVAEIALNWRRSRRLDAIAAFALVFLGLSLATSALGGDARLALAKDSALTGVAGLVFLGSLLASRPLIFFVSRSYMAGATAEAWEERWAARPRFRSTMRVITLVWGLGLLGDAVARVILAYTMSPLLVAGLSPVIAIAAFGGMIGFTIGYVRWVRARYAVPTSA
jgi:hypothetical protein